MARFETFARDIAVATEGLSPKAINAELARVARAELASAISSGQGSAIYERYVNGRPNAPEESVEAPGPILYVFSWWPEIIEFAIEFLQRRSPVRSGRFRDSWFVMVNEARFDNINSIPINATVLIVNDRPYARKIEVGHMRMSVPHGVAEDARLAVRRQYGKVVDIRKTMVELRGGYVLKGHFRRGHREFARRKIRPDTQAGAKMTYPAISLQMRE